MKTGWFVLGCVGAYGMVAPVEAGITLTYQGSEKQIISMEGNKARMERVLEGGESGGTMIFDGDAQKMLALEPKKKSYVEITPQEMKGLQDRVKHQMDDAMAKMTPEQRKQMGAAMSRMSPGQQQQLEALKSGASAPKAKAAPAIIWQTTGTHEKAAGFACEGYRGLKDGKVEVEGCFIPWSGGAVSKGDVAAMFKLEEFMSHLGDQFRHGAPGWQGIDQLPGLPGSLTRVSADGKKGRREDLISVKRVSISADQFQVPAGYNKTEIGGK